MTRKRRRRRRRRKTRRGGVNSPALQRLLRHKKKWAQENAEARMNVAIREAGLAQKAPPLPPRGRRPPPLPPRPRRHSFRSSHHWRQRAKKGFTTPMWRPGQKVQPLRPRLGQIEQEAPPIPPRRRSDSPPPKGPVLGSRTFPPLPKRKARPKRLSESGAFEHKRVKSIHYKPKPKPSVSFNQAELVEKQEEEDKGFLEKATETVKGWFGTGGGHGDRYISSKWKGTEEDSAEQSTGFGNFKKLPNPETNSIGHTGSETKAWKMPNQSQKIKKGGRRKKRRSKKRRRRRRQRGGEKCCVADECPKCPPEGMIIIRKKEYEEWTKSRLGTKKKSGSRLHRLAESKRARQGNKTRKRPAFLGNIGKKHTLKKATTQKKKAHKGTKQAELLKKSPLFAKVRAASAAQQNNNEAWNPNKN